MRKILLALTLLGLLVGPAAADVTVLSYSTGAGGGVSASGTNDFTGPNSFIDANTTFKDDVDTTKKAQFQLSSIGTGTTRTYTLPNGDITVAGINLAQTWSAAQTINSTFTVNSGTILLAGTASGVNGTLRWGTGNSTDGGIQWNTTQTPDTVIFATDPTSNHIVIAEAADRTFDFAHAAATDPALFIHSHNQSTSEWGSLSHNGTSFDLGMGSNNGIRFLTNGTARGQISSTQLQIGSGIGLSWSDSNAAVGNPLVSSVGVGVAKALTESTDTGFVRIAVTQGGSAGGYIVYNVSAGDGTDFQTRSGILPFAIVNKADTETVTLGTVTTATEVAALSTGTLTVAFTTATATNAVDIRANAVSSLTQTTLHIRYQVVVISGILTGPTAAITITPL